MTPQEQAILEAQRLLLEHFDSFVLVTRQADENNRDRIETTWHGTITDVIGMNSIAGMRLMAVAQAAGPIT